ncbi:MAG TPA: hypothetical protein VGQ57_09850 [Polyangiaceae bacterium]|jgi:hypothetical protein|nr:hypothetical protein [Polyangiaceae bacterium]
MHRYLVVVALGLFGCTSDPEIPGEQGAARIAVTALAAGADAQGLSMSSAWIALKTLTFVPCDPNAATLGTNDFPVDLFVTPPSFFEIDSGVTEYCGVRAELGPSRSTEPAELAQRSARIEGLRDDGNGFELSSTVALRLAFDSVPAGTPLNAKKLVLGVDFDAWFEGAGVNDAELTDDVALIDADHNAESLVAFDVATSAAFALYVDSDGDGTLTGDELSPVAGATAE